MICPACEGPTHVLESRRAEGGTATRRRRECSNCGRRFTTFERVEIPRFVRKRDGTRQPFDRTKLRAALLRAAHKRPVSPDQVEAIVERVEAAADRAGGELEAERVAELCLVGLRAIDAGAYLQFAGTLPATSPQFAEVVGAGSVRVSRQDG
jgi:transcriptional repressor NrdR